MSDNSTISPLMPGQETKGGRGPIATVIVIIVILLIGGLMIINAKKSPDETNSTLIDSTASSSEEVMSSSTSLDDIDRDVDNVDASVNNSGLDQLDKELNSI